MSYSITPITTQAVWENFFNNQQVNSFLHTWAWGEFNSTVNTRSGEKIFRFGIYDNSTLVGIALYIKTIARRGSYLFCPHGPIVRNDNPAYITGLIEHSISLAKSEGVDFVRYAPLLPNTVVNTDIFLGHGFRDAPIHVHPELAWMLDLTQSEDELMANMRKTSRHAIRKAIKDGVTVHSSTSLEDLKKFHLLYSETVQRQQFSPFSFTFLQQELETFLKTDSIRIFVAEYNNTPVAAAMVIFTPYSAFYHQGASSRQYPKLTAAHLMQWEAIMMAKQRGCKRYNFWGIADEAKPNHPWKGLTIFKKGFGGEAAAYVHAQDKPLRLKYWLNFSVETVRRRRRGY